MAKEGTGFPGQVQGREPDSKAPEDVFAKLGALYVALRYFDGSGDPQAQAQVALESTVRYPTGTGANGRLDMATATSYAIPAAVPTTQYQLVIFNASDVSVFWGFEDTNQNGIGLASGYRVAMGLGPNKSAYIYHSSAGTKTIYYTTVEK